MAKKTLPIACISLHLNIISLCASFILRHHSHLRKHTSHLRRTTSSLSSDNISVFDNVFDANTCTLLHELAVDHCNRCEAGSIFLRTPNNRDKLTPLEKAMDTILTSLNDTSPIVEYWSRSCYINIDAHADIDEDTLKQDGILRCPKNAHVLYMQIANSGEKIDSEDDRSKRMGPTVVFPDRKVAWGSTTAISSIDGIEEYIVDVENEWDEDEPKQLESSSKEEMVIVPAKTGRLLRFDGRAFHAVPKPPHRYVMSKKELNDLDKQEEENDYWGDGFDEEETDLGSLRSVLLFNTWPDGSNGPIGVVQDTFSLDDDDIPGDIKLYSASYFEYQSQMEEKRLTGWQQKYGDYFEQVWCNHVSDWKHLTVDRIRNKGEGIKRDIVTVPLMGNPSRRGCDIIQDVLIGSSKEMETLFYDSEQVSLVNLEHE